MILLLVAVSLERPNAPFRRSRPGFASTALLPRSPVDPAVPHVQIMSTGALDPPGRVKDCPAATCEAAGTSRPRAKGILMAGSASEEEERSTAKAGRLSTGTLQGRGSGRRRGRKTRRTSPLKNQRTQRPRRPAPGAICPPPLPFVASALRPPRWTRGSRRAVRHRLLSSHRHGSAPVYTVVQVAMALLWSKVLSPLPFWADAARRV